MSIGILSWNAHDTLISTLESYRRFGLNDDDQIIYFQEISNEDIRIAKEYGYKWIGSDTNVGIADAYTALVEWAKGEYFLFLENDWKLLRNPSSVLSAGRTLLEMGIVDVVRYRDRFRPGHPLWTRQFIGREMDRPTHLLDSVHWCDPAERYPSIIRRLDVQVGDKDEVFWTTTARNANWTNNPTMFRTDWLKTELLPHIGKRNVEIDVQSWWETTDYGVAQSTGLFEHWRI